MIRYLILTIVILFAMSCKSQTIYAIGTPPEQINEPSVYMKDINNHHDTIVGTWTWSFGNRSFIMNLQETENLQSALGDVNFSDEVRATYTYTINGNVVSEMTTIPDFPEISIAFSYYSTNHFLVTIHDEYSGKGKRGSFILTSPNTATMTLENIQGIKLGDDNGLEFAIPTSMILTKQ